MLANCNLIEVIVEVLDYAIAHVDKVLSSSETVLDVSMGNLEVNIYGDCFVENDCRGVGFGISTNENGYRRGTHTVVKASAKDINLIKYKLALISEMFLNYRVVQITDALNSVDSKIITTVEDIDFENEN